MPTLEFHLDDRSPFDRVFRISKDARLPNLVAQLLDDSEAVDLTTGTIKFSMVSEDSIDVTLASAAWTKATKKVTEVGAFADYTWQEGDKIFLSHANIVDGLYEVASRTDDDVIVLVGEISASDETVVKTAKVDDAAGTLDNPTSGIFSYAWAAGNTDTGGRFLGQFIVTVSSKDYRIPNQSNQRLRIIIGPRVN